jgi:hypothetical protein
MGYKELGPADHAICEDRGSTVWKERWIMMWDSRKEP